MHIHLRVVPAVGYAYPPNIPQGGTKGPMGTKYFTQFFTHNFDINISLRELTLYTIEIIYSDPLTLCTLIFAQKVFPQIIMLHLNCS